MITDGRVMTEGLAAQHPISTPDINTPRCGVVVGVSVFDDVSCARCVTRVSLSAWKTFAKWVMITDGRVMTERLAAQHPTSTPYINTPRCGVVVSSVLGNVSCARCVTRVNLSAWKTFSKWVMITDGKVMKEGLAAQHPTSAPYNNTPWSGLVIVGSVLDNLSCVRCVTRVRL
jgi:hypothetical protein